MLESILSIFDEVPGVKVEKLGYSSTEMYAVKFDSAQSKLCRPEIYCELTIINHKNEVFTQIHDIRHHIDAPTNSAFRLRPNATQGIFNLAEPESVEELVKHIILILRLARHELSILSKVYET